MNKQILFISIDGMTDQLGQSQVLPYLIGLTIKGYKISISSCEKKANFIKNKDVINAIISAHNITWDYCFYQSKIPFISQLQNFFNLRKVAAKKAIENQDIILHCRSYLPAIIGWQLKKKFNSKFIFDMRGFWADERIDGGIWKLSNPMHKFLYNYFKHKEIELIENADYLVTLTENAKDEIQSWKLNSIPPTEVIPCCADVNHFTIKSPEEKTTTKNNLNISENAYILGYLGSLGTWYMLDEMLDFFVELQRIKPNSIFFFITNDDEKDILLSAQKRGINKDCILVKSAKRNDVPQYISCFDVSLFFIKPLYSKNGSSPTKMAEILACGVPVISNINIGDVDEIIEENNCGILVPSFTKEAYKKTIDEMDTLSNSPMFYREVAQQNFSLEKGVDSYHKIYAYLSDK